MKTTRYVFLLLTICSASLTSTYVVTTLSGKVQGKTIKSEGVTLVEFLGIPFAKSPVGDLRFKNPEPLDCWKGVLDVTRKPAACIQNLNKPSPWIDHHTEQSEDCLYLNVFVPSYSGEQFPNNKSVIFWIHGGEYLYGSSSMDLYDSKILSSAGNNIVVTTNYRLGILGYFTTTLSEAPGNVALYDVLAALQWVKSNIEFFGGNPDAITISGESAGAMIASYLTISPLSRGLYSRAIIQSGSVIDIECPSVEENMAICDKVAEKVGCADKNSSLVSDSKRIVKCLRDVDAVELSAAGETVLYESGGMGLFPHHGDEFLPEKPIKALQKGNFQNSSILIGCTKDEGTLLLPSFMPNVFGYFGEKPFNVTKTFAESVMSEIFKPLPGCEQIIDYYLTDIEDDDYDSIREALSTALGDYVFYCPALYMAEKFADKGNDVYFYLFAHRSSNSPNADWIKAAHFDDVEFVFGMPLQYQQRYTEEEINFSLRIMELWSNFVQFGDPYSVDPQWPTFNKENSFYMSLDSRGSTVRQGLHESSCNLWRKYFGFL